MHELADGWAMSNLGSLADVAIGGTPSRDITRFWAAGSEDGYPWVSIADLRGRVINRTKETITAAGVTNSNVKLVKRGTVLMSFKLSLGRTAYAGCDLFTNEAIAAFLVNEKIRSDYLFYCLPNSVRLAATDVAIKGATLNKESLKKLRIPYPSRDIQRKIAAVLTSIDIAIEKTEALIAKYQQIKAGLMHDLFTRGVLPNGQLRPPREQVPELYQETAIGWIPREWDLATLESLLAPVPNNIRSGPFGSALLKHELVESGIPFLGIDNIHVESFNSDFRRFVSPKKLNELAKYAVRKKDVVITIMGTVGRCCVIPDDLEVALSSKHLWTMTFDQEKVIPRLICWQLNYSAWVKSWFRRATQGGIMDAIQSSTLKRLVLPVPVFDEQERIDSRYGFLSSRITHEEQTLQKLKLQKLGLMQDLLTGKVQVKLSEPSQEPLHA